MAHPVPFPPYQDRPINPYSKIGCGVSYGIMDPTGGSVAHSMVGYLSSTDAWFRRRDVCSLTPWGIGGSADGYLDGVIYRWMDYNAFDDVQPWSSGPWNPPGLGDGPAFVAKFGVEGINGRLQAIETSDGGNIYTPMSYKQWISFIWLSAAIAHEQGITSENYREYLAFMQHREFCKRAVPWPNTDKDCPFARIYAYTMEYINAIVTIMAYFEGKVNDLNKLVFTFAGMALDFRHVGRMRPGTVTPSPTPQPLPIEPTPVPTTGTWTAGASVRAKKEVLGREGPGTTFATVLPIKAGEFMKLVDGKVTIGNGIEWVDVVGVGGSAWVPKNDFELASKEATKPGPIFQDFTPNRTFTVGKYGATIRQWASRDSLIIEERVAPGTKIEVDGYYYGEKVDGENRWLVQNADPRGRIHAGAFVEKI